jgi:hypothetical protein
MDENGQIVLWGITLGEEYPFKITISTDEQVDDLLVKVKRNQGIPAAERPLLKKVCSLQTT